MSKKEIYIYSFYRFKKLKNIKKIKNSLNLFLRNKKIKGTVLLATEGVNGSISGLEKELNEFIFYIKKILKIRKISIKKNTAYFVPFNRLKIKLKNEIVSIGEKNIYPHKKTGKFISPSNWNNILKDKDIRVIDTRNIYEVNIGRFKNSLNPKTKSFREFPKILKNLKIAKNIPVAMYCTGGIRCEKASAYLIKNGYKNVMQLEGGILNYLEYQKKYKKENLWKGECFVFDNRIAVNKSLKKGKYIQCHACRHPITKKDIDSKKYKKGIHCPYCYSLKTKKQLKRYQSRQLQIDLSEMRNENHPFKKTLLRDL